MAEINLVRVHLSAARRGRLIITSGVKTTTLELVTRSGNHRVRKVSDLEYRIDANPEKGMNVPVTIYANDSLISKMITDRSIDQAANVATLPGVKKHVVVLPDGSTRGVTPPTAGKLAFHEVSLDILRNPLPAEAGRKPAVRCDLGGKGRIGER